MRNIILLLFLLLVQQVARGNDGVYLSEGGCIYPVEETSISMDREVLSFKIRNRIAYVDVQFQFYNPESKARKLLVGFQAPVASGDVTYSQSNENQITNFTVMQGGRVLPYKSKAAACANCELKDKEELEFNQISDGLFVYLFEITFQPGYTQLNHSYNFPSSSNVMEDQVYGYILTTGAKWANGHINELTINIDMGLNSYFFVEDIFDDAARWSIIGTGKISVPKSQEVYDRKMVRVLSGYLQIKASHLKPTENISFGVINPHFMTTPSIHSINFYLPRDLKITSEYSKYELRILRNMIYAQYGYRFADQQLLDYFRRFDWYIPDPNLEMEEIRLSSKEKEFVEQIIAIENR